LKVGGESVGIKIKANIKIIVERSGIVQEGVIHGSIGINVRVLCGIAVRHAVGGHGGRCRPTIKD